MDYATMKPSETSNSLHHTEQVAKQCQKGKQEIALDGFWHAPERLFTCSV
jgi:hypothetical protein